MVFLLAESPQFFFCGVDCYVTDHVFFGPTSTPGNLLVGSHLQVVQIAFRLQHSNVTSKHAVHGFELGNFLISEATSAHADTQAEGA